MPKTIPAYLQLIRLPNVVTAAADSLAGWLLVTRLARRTPRNGFPSWPPSMVLYASGIMLNDVFDFEIDQRRTAGPAAAFGPGLQAHCRLDRRRWVWCSGRAWRSRAARLGAAWSRPCWRLPSSAITPA